MTAAIDPKFEVAAGEVQRIAEKFGTVVSRRIVIREPTDYEDDGYLGDETVMIFLKMPGLTSEQRVDVMEACDEWLVGHPNREVSIKALVMVES